MKNTIFKIFFYTLLLIVFVNCKKNNEEIERSYPNGIKVLTNSTMEVKSSSFTLGSNKTTTVTHIDMESSDGINFIVLFSNEVVAVSTDEDNEIDGKMIIFSDSNNTTYLGQNFSLDEDGDAYVLNGQLTNSANAEDTKSMTIRIESSQIGAGNTTYEIDGEHAIINGTLGTYAYNQLLEINKKYPEVNTFVLAIIEGSINDEVNMETGRLLRKAGYGTHLLTDSQIFSGGVDLFCAGKTRTREAGSKIGVHSWCCFEGKTADKLPKNSSGHDAQLAYFKEMLGDSNGPNFYYFTINAAPFDGIHLMSDAEIATYKLITQ